MEGNAHNSVDLDETHENENQYKDNPGAGETQGGYGSASLTECLERLGAQPNTTTSATCHSEEGSRDTSSLPTDPSQEVTRPQGQKGHATPKHTCAFLRRKGSQPGWT